MAKSIVSIVKGNDAEKMVDEALSLLGGSALIKPGSTIVIKPNAGHPSPPETAGCTSPEMVSAVIKVLRKAKPKEIIVAEAGAIGCDTMECFEVSGIGKAAKEAGADRIVDIKHEKDLIKVPIRDARSDITQIMLPKFLIEAEHIVNLPIFKPHVAMVYTCALKNLKGLVQDKIHYQMHQTNLADAMFDVWSVVRADLNIVDMIRPQEGFGPQNGLPVDFGCVLASQDPVAVDATCCRMVGLDVNTVSYFGAARKRNLGNFHERNIEIRGRAIKEVFKPMWLPYLGGFGQWPEYEVYEESACSSCQGLIAYSLERLKAEGQYDKNAGVSIIFGRKKDLPKVPPKELILVGNCLKSKRDKGIFVGGCPPNEGAIVWSIVNRQEWSRPDVMDGTYKRNAESVAQSAKPMLDYSKKLREKLAEKLKK